MQGKLYPNGEFTVGTLPQRRLKIERFNRYVHEYQDLYEDLVSQHLEMFGLQQTIAVLKSDGSPESLEAVRDLLDRGEDDTSPFEFTNVLNSKKEQSKPRRGSKGISSHARRQVRNAAFYLETERQRSTLTFLTLTLPPIPEAELRRAMATHWSKVCHNFFVWLYDRLQAVGLPAQWVGVTEIQTERMQKTGLPFPHLHVVFQGRHSFSHWALTPQQVRAEWRGLWKKTGLPFASDPSTYWDSCENMQRVELSVEAYLGKYLSKGISCTVDDIPKTWRNFLPTNWHFISQPIKDWIARRTRSGEFVGQVLCTLVENDPPGVFLYYFPITLQREDIKLHLGWSGKLGKTAFEQVGQIISERAHASIT